MKVKICWYDDEADDQSELVGTLEFDFDSSSEDTVLSDIGNVVETYEDTYSVCIDQGGDDKFYELNIADYDPDKNNIAELAANILKEIEEKLQISVVKYFGQRKIISC